MLKKSIRYIALRLYCWAYRDEIVELEFCYHAHDLELRSEYVEEQLVKMGLLDETTN